MHVVDTTVGQEVNVQKANNKLLRRLLINQ